MDWIDCKDPGDVGTWHTPPKCEDKPVLRQYASLDGVIYRRRWDQSDGSRTYEKRFLEEEENFSPWQEEPS